MIDIAGPQLYRHQAVDSGKSAGRIVRAYAPVAGGQVADERDGRVEERER
jgi:hypothetical protein